MPLHSDVTESIRHAVSEADVTAVRELLTEYAAELGLDLTSQGFAQELAELPGSYAPPKGALLIAMLNDQYAGCVALRSLEKGIAEMKRLFVRERYRASGLGRQLTQRLVVHARQLGYRALRLDTLPAQMPQASALYRSLGFVAIAPYWNNPLAGVEYLELELSIAPPGPKR